MLNLYYTKRTDLSYKVNYLEKDTDKVLSPQKVKDGMTFGTVITSSDEVIKIDGYNYDSVDKDTLEIGTGDNVINIYYTKRTDLSYMLTRVGYQGEWNIESFVGNVEAGLKNSMTVIKRLRKGV